MTSLSFPPIPALAACITLGAAAPAWGTTFHAQRVVSFTPGSGQSAALNDPAQALGGPTGAGSGGGSTTGVYNFGVGGSITLGFGSEEQPAAIADADGTDFIVFENPFFISNDPSQSFADLLFVEVSSNGVDFVRFPTTAPQSTPNGSFTTVDPATARGFAGVNPVLTNVDDDDNLIDPFDPLTAGGDAFDLADLATLDAVINGLVDLQNIQFLRLQDVLGDGSLVDSLSNPIFDDAGVFDNGAELDAVSVIHGVTVPEPTGLITLLGAGTIMLLRRRA